MKVTSDARKLILDIPQGGKIVSFPDGATISPYGQNNTWPTIVVQNCSDPEKPWQGADHNGVIIMNGIPGEVAEQLLKLYNGTMESIHDIIEAAAEMSYTDVYTTSKDWVSENLSAAGTMLGGFTGIVKRDSRDLTEVFYENGVFYVIHSGEPKRIEPDILVRDYRQPDGEKIDLTEIVEVL